MLQDAKREGEMGFHLCHQCDRLFITYVPISDRMRSGEFSVMGESLMEQCCVEAVNQWIKVTLLTAFCIFKSVSASFCNCWCRCRCPAHFKVGWGNNDSEGRQIAFIT